MELMEAEKELSIRLYRWALAEFSHELETFCPRIRAIENFGVRNFLHLIWPLTQEQERKLAVALVKHAHPFASEYVGETATDDEKQLAQNYLQIGSYHIARGTYTRRPHYEEGEMPPKRKQIFALMRHEITANLPKSVLGKRGQMMASDLFYERDIGNWRLATMIDTVGASVTNYGAIEHSFFLHRLDDDLIKTAASTYRRIGIVDYLPHLGIGSTSWEVHNAEDIAIACTALAELHISMTEGISSMLEGLS